MAATPQFGAAVLTLFFEDPKDMSLSNRTCLQLAQESIVVCVCHA
jgi:hypothetical protein